MIEALLDVLSDIFSGTDVSDVTETVSDVDVSDVAEAASNSANSTHDLQFGSYPSEIDSSYHPYVDAQNNAYISQDDYIHGNNKYVPK
ncbi:hypothetical protein V2P20_10365 [Methylobacter sp. Wu1]|uniref:hypothetical protein n=1 Tax=Methylobacter sp. Wu1 TaxID=3119359 RepID=UPI002F933BA4